MEVAFSQIWYWFLLGAVGSYLMGCFNFAILISRFKHKDIRGEGSGNPGTMNMTRTFGLKVGIFNFFCDALKGAIPVLTAYLAFRHMTFVGTSFVVSDFARFWFGTFAVIGHIFPVFLKFKGGKGIATTLGSFWMAISCEVWWFAIIIPVFFFLVVMYILVYEWGSMGSLIAVSSLTIWQAVIFFDRYTETNVWLIATLMLLLFINLLTWIAHHKNIYRLVAGQERRTIIRKSRKA